MRTSNIKVSLNARPVAVLMTSVQKAAILTAEQMRTEIIAEQVIPFDTGYTQNVGTYVDDTKRKDGLIEIVHDTPYADKIYFHPEWNFQTTHNANARGLWWDHWLRGAKRGRPVELMKFFYRKFVRSVVK